MKIVVIEACGLNVAYLGCYGNDWVATPNLDRMAAEGVVFDWHIADQPELLPTTPWRQRSVGTGKHSLPGQPPLTAEAAPGPRVVRCEELASFGGEAIRALGANDAWLWIEGPSLLPPWRLDDELLDAYFDEDDVEEGLAPWPDPPLGLVKLNEADVLQLQNTYAATVTVFDAQLGMILDHLGRDTLLCVTARSGFPLGEHGMIGTPRPWLHDELVHVPLLMRLPNGAESGKRVSALTQPLDLLPTIAERMPATHGRSLWPLIRDEIAEIRPYAVSALRVADHESWLMRTPDRAFHLPIVPADAAPQLFVKPEDRSEVNNLYQQQSEVAEAMEKALRAFARAIIEPGALTHPPLDEA